MSDSNEEDRAYHSTQTGRLFRAGEQAPTMVDIDMADLERRILGLTTDEAFRIARGWLDSAPSLDARLARKKLLLQYMYGGAPAQHLQEYINTIMNAGAKS